MIKQPVARNVGIAEHGSGRSKSTVGARRRSKSVGKPKLESGLVKQSLKPFITLDDDAREEDLPSRKHSVTNSEVKKFISLTSSVAIDDHVDSGLAATKENHSYDSKDRALRTTSFSGYKSSNILHKTASSRISTQVDAGLIRHFDPTTSQYKIGDVQSYKLRDDLENTDEEATETADSEATDDPDENDDDTAESPTNDEENTGDAEGEVPGNPEDETNEANENEDGQPGPPLGDKPEASDSAEGDESTVDKILIKFFLLALICKAVSLFFQPNKCTC